MAFSREGSYRARTGRRFVGVRGEILGKIENRESEVTNAKGVTNHVEERDALQLVDNEILHAGRTDPLVGCGQCRRGRPKGWFHEEELPNHGLLLKENAFLCEAEGCGEYCCKKHVRWINGQPWCVRCTEKCDCGTLLREFMSILRWLFFRKKEV